MRETRKKGTRFSSKNKNNSYERDKEVGTASSYLEMISQSMGARQKKNERTSQETSMQVYAASIAKIEFTNRQSARQMKF